MKLVDTTVCFCITMVTAFSTLLLGCNQQTKGKPEKVFSFPSGEYVYTDLKRFTPSSRKSRQGAHLCKVSYTEKGIEINFVSSKITYSITGRLDGNKFIASDSHELGATKYQGTLTSDGNIEGTLSGGRDDKKWKGKFRILRKEHSKIESQWIPSLSQSTK